MNYCRLYMARQTQLPDFWVIVDDCDPMTAAGLAPVDFHIVRPDPRWKAGAGNTVARNFVAGLDYIQKNIPEAEIITVMEDDDWYSRSYLQNMAFELRSRLSEGIFVIGENNTVFYHVGSRLFRRNWHPGTASLCSMSFHASIIPGLLNILNGYTKHDVDRRIYRSVAPEQFDLLSSDLVVGIKGIPGEREHAGIGSKMAFSQGTPDPDLRLLRNLIGDDADLYAHWFIDPEFVPIEKKPRPQPPTSRRRRRVLAGRQLEIDEARKRRRR